MIEIRRLQPITPYGSNCYLISDMGRYAVVDPSADYAATLRQYPEIEGKIAYVLITHAHFDHILTLKDWAEHSERVIVGLNDAGALSNSSLNCYLGFLGVDDGYYGKYETVQEGQALPLGSAEIVIIDTPGHTPGGVSYMIEDNVFSGDTVFAKGGYGRCDLPGGDIDILEKSIIKLITKFTDVTFYPGHGESTKLQELIYYFM